jgi:hypothetical protein
VLAPFKKDGMSPKQKSSLEQNPLSKTGTSKGGKNDASAKQLSWRKGSGVLGEKKEGGKVKRVPAVVNRLGGGYKGRPKVVEKLLNKKGNGHQEEPLLSARMPSVQEDSGRRMTEGLSKTIPKGLATEISNELTERRSGYLFAPNELTKEVLRLIAERNKKWFGRSDNLTLIIAFLHRGLRKVVLD